MSRSKPLRSWRTRPSPTLSVPPLAPAAAGWPAAALVGAAAGAPLPVAGAVVGAAAGAPPLEVGGWAWVPHAASRDVPSTAPPARSAERHTKARRVNEGMRCGPL